MSHFKNAAVPLLYSAVVLIGGVVGYLTAQSLVSLIAAFVFGLPLLGASFATWRGIKSGYYTALGLTIALTLFFHYRFVVTQTFMPAGMMAIVSVLAIIGMIIWRPKKG
jgi:uncharacterized membrane protein (UPF0136 family)